MNGSDSRSRSPDGEPFLILHPFMWQELGLRGTELLVFARVYGFCKSGGSYYESRRRTAAYLGLSERSVTRAMGSLVERGILVDLDPFASLDGVSTRSYALADDLAMRALSHANDNLSPPDSVSGIARETGEGLSDMGVPSWHLKSKCENKLD